MLRLSIRVRLRYWMATRFGLLARPFGLSVSTRLKPIERDALLSVSWAIGRHSDFGSSSPGEVSIWSALCVLVGQGQKELLGATMVAPALLWHPDDVMWVWC